jgi:tRNA dimethylallyltransferase
VTSPPDIALPDTPRQDAVPEVIAVFGPTASGKSAVAEILAGRLGTEVVSADALQVYRELPILTNQSTRPTRLVAIRSVREGMSVGEYAPLAHEAIDELVSAHGVALVAGGTGLYLRAALVDLDVPPPAAHGRREALEREYDAAPGRAHARLAALDAQAADAVHPHDRRRVVRALELAEAGRSLAPDGGRLWGEQTRRPSLVVGLELPREELERRIRARTESMLARGVRDEVRRAIAEGISRTAEAALGVRELAELPDDEAVERIVVRTRRYAAYQRKWMRRVPGLVRVDATGSAVEVADAILEVARAR